MNAKKHVLRARGSFRPVCLAHVYMLRSARERFVQDLGSAPEQRSAA